MYSEQQNESLGYGQEGTGGNQRCKTEAVRVGTKALGSGQATFFSISSVYKHAVEFLLVVTERVTASVSYFCKTLSEACLCRTGFNKKVGVRVGTIF